MRARYSTHLRLGMAFLPKFAHCAQKIWRGSHLGLASLSTRLSWLEINAPWTLLYCEHNICLHVLYTRPKIPRGKKNPLAPFPLLSSPPDCLKSIGQVENPDSEPTPSRHNNITQQQQQIQDSSTSTEKPSESVVYRVHLPSKSYKSVRITVYDSAETLLVNLCEKLSLRSDCVKYLALFERVKDRERRVKPTELIADIVKMWPTILGETGNETHKQCYFMAVPVSTAPDYVLKAVNY